MSKNMVMLRKKAHDLKPVVQIGKNGLTDGVIKEIKGHLETKGLIKVKLLKSATPATNTEELLSKTNAALVEKKGGSLVLTKSPK